MRKPFPSPLITERMIIRTPTEADAEAMNEAVVETWEQLHRWMPWAVTVPTVEESRAVCARMSSNTANLDDFALYAFDRHDGRLLLATGCHVRDWDVPIFEIGYWCRASAQGQGYVTEAVKAITRVAFQEMGARRVEIRVDEKNTASRAVAERCGYPLESVLVKSRRGQDGVLSSMLVFAMVVDDPARTA